MDNRNDLQMPSGIEVECASMHSPTCSSGVHNHSFKSSAGRRDKLNSIRSDMMRTANRLRGQLTDKKSELMTSASRRVNGLRATVCQKANELRNAAIDRANTLRTSARDRVNVTRMRIDNELRTNTAKWTGIAAGAGLGLGLLSRLIRHRMQARRSMPEAVIIG